MVNLEFILYSVFTIFGGVFAIIIAMMPEDKQKTVWLRIIKKLYGKNYKKYLPKWYWKELGKSNPLWYKITQLILYILGGILILVGIIGLILGY